MKSIQDMKVELIEFIKINAKKSIEILKIKRSMHLVGSRMKCLTRKMDQVGVRLPGLNDKTGKATKTKLK